MPRGSRLMTRVRAGRSLTPPERKPEHSKSCVCALMRARDHECFTIPFSPSHYALYSLRAGAPSPPLLPKMHRLPPHLLRLAPRSADCFTPGSHPLLYHLFSWRSVPRNSNESILEILDAGCLSLFRGWRIAPCAGLCGALRHPLPLPISSHAQRARAVCARDSECLPHHPARPDLCERGAL